MIKISQNGSYSGGIKASPIFAHKDIDRALISPLVIDTFDFSTVPYGYPCSTLIGFCNKTVIKQNNKLFMWLM